MANVDRSAPVAADPAAAVESTMFRALAVLRVALLLNALGLGWYRRANLDHPTAGLLVLLAITLWTGIALVAYSSPRWRRTPLLVADLALTLAAIAVSPLVKGDDMRATLPGFWVAGVVFAWALHWQWRGGLIASAVVALADVGVRGATLTQTNYANIFLLLIGGPIVGFLAGLLIEMAQDRARAERAAAAEAERVRLARVVHDGVLQVLALVQRTANAAGGEFAELGRLAAVQEQALRSLVQRDHASGVPAAGRGDLMESLAAISRRGNPRVELTTTAPSIAMPDARVTELTAAVGSCLDNVSAHVGPQATAWVLVEDLGAEVSVSVRDEGPGIADGRLEAAAAEGRLGVSESIKGRIADLGGRCELTTRSGGGTEWEMYVPKEAP